MVRVFSPQNTGCGRRLECVNASAKRDLLERRRPMYFCKSIGRVKSILKMVLNNIMVMFLKWR